MVLSKHMTVPCFANAKKEFYYFVQVKKLPACHNNAIMKVIYKCF